MGKVLLGILLLTASLFAVVIYAYFTSNLELFDGAMRLVPVFVSLSVIAAVIVYIDHVRSGPAACEICRTVQARRELTSGICSVCLINQQEQLDKNSRLEKEQAYKANSSSRQVAPSAQPFPLGVAVAVFAVLFLVSLAYFWSRNGHAPSESSSRITTSNGSFGYVRTVALVLYRLIGALLFLVGVALAASGRDMLLKGPSLVLRSFRVANKASESILVEIVGRQMGLIAWILTRTGWDSSTMLRVTQNEVSLKKTSLFGQRTSVVPIGHIASTHCGYSRSLTAFVLSALFFAGSLESIGVGNGVEWWYAILLFVVACGFLIAYLLSKRVVVMIMTNGGLLMGLSFKRSVIDDVPVDLEKARAAIRLLNLRVCGGEFPI